MPKPQATLLSITSKPLHTMWNAWFWSRDPSYLTTNFLPSTSELVQHALTMLKEHVTIPEAVMLVWGLENIPRSFQEQIVRTRKAAFFCETHRVVDKSNFQREGDFFSLPAMNEVMLSEISDCYQIAMVKIGRHTSELQSHSDLVCRLLLEKKKKTLFLG